jgi:glycerophosphoryl diester phosphodiesterase
MRLIAHRGFDDQYSANTIAAVEQAVPRSDAIELDVRRCESGELVVAHNDIVDIAIDGIDRVDDLSAAELADLDAHDGEGIQTLNRVVEAIPADTDVNFELKEADLIDDALGVARDAPNHVIVSSFDAETIHNASERAEGVSLAYILDATPADDIEFADSIDCQYVHPHTSLCLVTDLVSEAHDAGMEVNAWTVDSRASAWALEKRGVDGVIASSPDVLDSGTAEHNESTESAESVEE